MWKQTLKSSVALIEVEHKIFTWRSVWSGTRLGHLSLHVFVFSDYFALKEWKTLQHPDGFSSQPVQPLWNIQCTFAFFMTMVNRVNSVLRKQMFIGTAAILSQTFFLLFLRCNHAHTKAILLGPLLSHFSFARVTFFQVWIIGLLSVKLLDLEIFK